MTLNKAMLIGNLGRDPEVRYTQKGDAVANFSLATSYSWKDRGGQRQEKTEWHNIVVWGGLADFAQNYLKKGKQVYIEGRLQTSEWTDKENVRHFKTEIVAENIRFVGSAPEGSGGTARASGGYQRNDQAPPANRPPDNRPPDNRQPSQPNQGGAEEETYLEDDIPF